MKVLYLSHTSRISGGERSLLDLLAGLPARVSPVVACPPGPLAEAVDSLGVAAMSIPGTDVSLKLHPTRTPRGLAELMRGALAVRAVARTGRADLVHANSTRAGLMAVAARKAGAPPALVHLHDSLAEGRTAGLSRRVVLGAAGILANSRHTAASFGLQGFAGTVRIVNNPVDLERFDPARLTRDDCRRRLGLDAASFVVALVAQITPWKGQDTAIRALARLAEAHEAVRLLIVGSTTFDSSATRFDNRDYLESLKQLAGKLGVGERVDFLGDREDIPEILRAADVALTPSWEEPFGRAVTEAMAMELPVVATAVGGPAEIVRDGVDGYLRPPREPAAWSSAVESLLVSPELRKRMGSAGRSRVVECFSLEAHVKAVLSAYDEVLDRHGPEHAHG